MWCCEKLKCLLGVQPSCHGKQERGTSRETEFKSQSSVLNQHVEFGSSGKSEQVIERVGPPEKRQGKWGLFNKKEVKCVHKTVSRHSPHLDHPIVPDLI